ncbi:hypothetical protein ACFX2G_019270 [Malus domestica]
MLCSLYIGIAALQITTVFVVIIFTVTVTSLVVVLERRVQYRNRTALFLLFHFLTILTPQTAALVNPRVLVQHVTVRASRPESQQTRPRLLLAVVSHPGVGSGPAVPPHR